MKNKHVKIHIEFDYDKIGCIEGLVLSNEQKERK